MHSHRETRIHTGRRDAPTLTQSLSYLQASHARLYAYIDVFQFALPCRHSDPLTNIRYMTTAYHLSMPTYRNHIYNSTLTVQQMFRRMNLTGVYPMGVGRAISHVSESGGGEERIISISFQLISCLAGPKSKIVLVRPQQGVFFTVSDHRCSQGGHWGESPRLTGHMPPQDAF